MALLYKISSDYENLYTIIFLTFILGKIWLIRHQYFFYRTRVYIALFWQVIVNKNISVDASIFKVRGRQGFTLVELIMTVAILAIIVTIATPIIQTQLARMEAKRIKGQLTSTLSLAKAESYTRKENVLVCLSDTEGHCHRDGDKMLLVFVDKSNSKNFNPQIDLLISQQPLNLKYSKLSLRVGNRRHYIKFWGNSGTPRGHFGHIKYCPTVAYNKAMYLISFNQTGIIKQKLNEDHPTQCDQ